MSPVLAPLAAGSSAAWRIAALAGACLKLELDTYPKPGLVSPVDQGSHPDMDAALLRRSAETLTPFFADLAAAGAAGAGMGRLRQIGMAAEAVMLAATGGVNTHRGALFGLGLLAAAAGFRDARPAVGALGEIVAELWAHDILASAQPEDSHGAQAARQYRAGGARMEAAAGFPSIYGVGLPALRLGRLQAPADPEAARVQACMALVAAVEDTNLLYRGGLEGLAFAQSGAAAFLAAGGVGRPDWRASAQAMHHAFIDRRLSPGGSADLLAMTLFVDAMGP